MRTFRLGFTGTRNGMTEAQKAEISARLVDLAPFTLHHGDCVGADAEMHEICRNMTFWVGNRPFRPEIESHPPISRPLRAFTDADVVHEPLGFLERDRKIVLASWGLWAAPKASEEEEAGGTWYTVRYARTCKRSVTIFWPDGRVTREER